MDFLMSYEFTPLFVSVYFLQYDTAKTRQCDILKSNSF